MILISLSLSVFKTNFKTLSFLLILSSHGSAVELSNHVPSLKLVYYFDLYDFSFSFPFSLYAINIIFYEGFHSTLSVSILKKMVRLVLKRIMFFRENCEGKGILLVAGERKVIVESKEISDLRIDPLGCVDSFNVVEF